MEAARKRRLPHDVYRALLRVLETLKSASDELKELSRTSGGINHGETLDWLSRWLYNTWYCAIQSVEETPSPCVGRENLVSALRASVSASTRWESGWVAVQASPSGVCVAGRGSQTRELRPGEYANVARHGLSVAPGDSIAVRELVEWTDQSTGFWCARSWGGEPLEPLVRLYFSVGWEHVGHVLVAVTKTLDDLKIPYSLKCPSLAAAYSRVDSLVVYLQADSWPTAASAIKATSRQTSALLRSVTPPLTKQIALGVAFAEDPGNKRSFGESRCDALAPGALTLLRDGRFPTGGGVAALAESLEAAGIDPVRPWLNSARRA